MNKLKVLLIGGTGTISSAVMEKLADRPDMDVTVLNRGRKEIRSDVHQIVADLSEKGALERAVNGLYFDVVVDFLIYTEEQAEERIKVLSGACQQFIFISTVVTFNHENTFWLNENSEQKNRYSRYGQNKTAAEVLFRRAAANSFPITIVRPSQTYGYDRIPLSVKGRTCWSVISRILHGKPVIVHGDGKGIWHMMHTEDFAANFVQLVGNKEAIGHSINLVNPSTVTWDMIYHEIGSQLNKKVKIVHIASDTLACSGKYNNLETILGDKQYSNDYSKLELEQLIPDFSCSITMRKGIEMYISYMRSHPELQIEDDEFDAWCDEVTKSYEAYMKMFSEKY